ncbi:FAD-dependent monooxygenase [Amycolatopsis sp. NPDC048633]|uniref:FAD-dependent monooxygenase n=1 Tax=Amycolatopsis sp. NPDC048633 TaxID=3157095 RepID=UPI00340B5013
MDNNEQRRRALVVGLGISGISTAIRLRQAGWEPEIIERSPERRTGGYFVLLWGAGRSAAERLGFLVNMPDHTARDGAHYEIDRMGNRTRVPSFSDHPLGPHRMLRGDVENAAFDALPSDIKIRFGTIPSKIQQDGDGVDVTLLDTASGQTSAERFDLVVGTDGLRSTVRSLAFGPHERYLHRMGRITCAFQVSAPLPGLAQEDGVALLERARSMWVFGFQDRIPTVMLSYESDDIDAEFIRPPAQRLREVFGSQPTGKLLGTVLDEAERAENILFDSVEQVRMDSWHRGRVVLVGDSAWCVTLYAGMGVSAGLCGADLLGTMLERHPVDVERALTEWETQLRPSIKAWQECAGPMRILFNPDGRREVLKRRLTARGRTYPIIGPVIRRKRMRTMAEKNFDAAAA